MVHFQAGSQVSILFFESGFLWFSILTDSLLAQDDTLSFWSSPVWPLPARITAMLHPCITGRGSAE